MRNRSTDTYVGIHNDLHGGMTAIGTIIKDAWVFGLIPKDETCEGWKLADVQMLYDKVSAAWAPYGHLVSRLPPELREKHTRIYDAAIARAQAAGWVPGQDMDSDME
ncbi:hypothetical protein [Thioalkalivibrio sulfidiphilus]|uniref:hypothetical protein n=1 Tax=Thioalkalivibrio sulfidiphilus TaxID=1033854 RepID=UPI003B2F4781